MTLVEAGIGRDLRGRVISITPERGLLTELLEISNDDLIDMMLDPDLATWRHAVQHGLIAPILREASKRFSGQDVGVRMLVFNLDDNDSEVADQRYVTGDLLKMSAMLQSGTDRPGKRYLDLIDLSDRDPLNHPSWEKFLIKLGNRYKQAMAVRQYNEARRNIGVAVGVFDLSLMLRSPMSGDYNMPDSSKDSPNLIKAVYPFDVTLLLPEEL